MGADASSRTVGSNNHLEPTPTPTTARGIHRALQHTPATPLTSPTSTKRHWRRRPDPTKPSDRTDQHMWRTDQRIPNRSLNHIQPNPNNQSTASTRSRSILHNTPSSTPLRKGHSWDIGTFTHRCSESKATDEFPTPSGVGVRTRPAGRLLNETLTL